MVTISRLATIAPEIHEALLAMPSEKRTTVAKSAARWAVDRALPSDGRVIEWLEAGNGSSLEALANQLDVRYFDLADASGGGADSQVAQAFSEARAVSAAALAVKGEAHDAVYEAAQSTDLLNEFCAFVLEKMHAV